MSTLYQTASFENLPPDELAAFRQTTAAIRKQAAKHANLPNARFTLAERGADYIQNFYEIYIPPVNDASLDTIDAVSRMVMGNDENGANRFDQLRSVFKEAGDEVAMAKALIESGGVLTLVTNHAELSDIAMAMAALQCEIGDPQLVQRTRMLAGPIMKELDIFGHPAIKALQESTGIFVGFPATKNTIDAIDNGDIDKELVSTVNKKGLKELKTQCKVGEISLLVLAPSGSTDDENESRILMKPASSATVKIAKKFCDAALPIVLLMGRESRFGFRVGPLTPLAGEVSIHDIMETEIAPIYAELAHKPVIYERPKEKSAKLKSLGSTAIENLS